MVSQTSFGDIIVSLRERKKFERESRAGFVSKICSCCKCSIEKNGVSTVDGVCNTCVSKSLKGTW